MKKRLSLLGIVMWQMAIILFMVLFQNVNILFFSILWLIGVEIIVFLLHADTMELKFIRYYWYTSIVVFAVLCFGVIAMFRNTYG